MSTQPKVFAIPNLRSTDAQEITPPWDPASQIPPPPPLPSKTAFRAWCADENTQHAFFSLVEGLTPSARVTSDNPPHLIHGIVGDYDATIDVANMADVAQVVRDHVPKLVPVPSWVSATYSGNARVVWLFEHPIQVDDPVFIERVLKELSKRLAVSKLLAGFDKTSLNLTQYFAAGSQWTPVPDGAPIPKGFVRSVLFDVAKNTRVGSGRVTIPIEVVAEEVDRRFPGRWVGDFVVGARGPLFWIDDGIAREGAQVGDFGMICYSDRAGGTFVSWSDIFGPQFVRDFEERRIEDVADNWAFDGARFWAFDEDRGWQDYDRDMTRLLLSQAGFSRKLAKGKELSEVDEVVSHIARIQRVSGAAPMVFHRPGIVDYNGTRFLNTSRRTVIRPFDDPEMGDPERWPWLREYLSGLFADGGESKFKPLDHFLAWLQRFYVGALNLDLEPGHAIVIAGPPSRGKTLLSRRFIGMTLFGGFGDAGRYLAGGTSFNRALCEHAVWSIDDGTSSATAAEHRRFSEALKRQIANPDVQYEAKFRDDTTIPWMGRVIITCNEDAESLSILPHLDHSILDKLMLFKLTPFSREVARLFSQRPNERMAEEARFFLTWLVNWEPPEGLLDPSNPRYGVRPYHSSELVSHAGEIDPAARVAEILCLWARSCINARVTEWRGSVTQLMVELNQMDGVDRLMSRFDNMRFGKALSGFVRLYPNVASKYRSKGAIKYRIDLAELAALDADIEELQVA